MDCLGQYRIFGVHTTFPTPETRNSRGIPLLLQNQKLAFGVSQSTLDGFGVESEYIFLIVLGTS